MLRIHKAVGGRLELSSSRDPGPIGRIVTIYVRLEVHVSIRRFTYQLLHPSTV